MLRSRIMYIECKADSLNGEARIGWVYFSKTGRTMYYAGKSLIKVTGYKYNCIDEESGEAFWISGCKKDGTDRLYASNAPIYIDENVRNEYWTSIKNQPHLKFKSTL